jgi:hypothetical protein
MNQRLMWGLLLIVLWGCSNDESTSGDPETDRFFDVEGYFEGEIDRLQREQPDFLKEVSLNGKQESIQPDTLDFEKELSVFLNSDINKVSWIDSYSADTTRHDDGSIATTVYKAQKEKLRTRLLEVSYEADTPRRVRIINRTENAVLDADQELIYEPETGMEIQQTQQIRFMKPNEISIAVRFRE